MRHHIAFLFVILVLGAILASPAPADSIGRIQLELIGRYDGGLFSPSAVQNPPAWDPVRKHLYVGSQARRQVDVLDISDPADPTVIGRLGIADLPGGPALMAKIGGGISSLALRGDVLALAFAAARKDDTGIVILFDIVHGKAIGAPIDVGFAPNAMAFVVDRPRLVLVNQGDPGPTVDPPGSVSVIDLRPGPGAPGVSSVFTVDFTAFDGREDALRAAGVRLATSHRPAARQLEPESLAIADDGGMAWLTLPRNNAIAAVDLDTLQVTALLPLGAKDMRREGAGFDASDRDGRINISPWPVEALYQPDGIAAYRTPRGTFLVTANEGDPRPGEEIRVGDATLDPKSFPNAAWLQRPEHLGRLHVARREGDRDRDGDLDRLVAFGARSLAVWSTDGTLLAETDDMFERIVARDIPAGFNTTDSKTRFDDRSDDRGPEPESIAVGQVGDRHIAFVAFERVGSLIAVDVTDPEAPRFQDHVSTRNYAVDPRAVCTDDTPKTAACRAAGDLGPESLLFIDAAESPVDAPLLIVRHDLSDTLTIYAVRVADAAGPIRPR